MKFRKPLTITSRTSSVTNGFVQAIIPSIEPTAEETDEALAVLGVARSSDLSDRIARLERFVAWARIEPLLLSELAGKELWDTGND